MPIELIVIIAIAVLVLIVLAAFFSGAFGGSTGTIDLQTAFNSACNKLRNVYNCDQNSVSDVKVSYTPVGKPNEPNFPLYGGTQSLCGLLSYTTPYECARACGCPGNPE